MNEPPLEEKVAFLRQPAAWGEGTVVVEARETHMSWVFLTRSHAWKLKKPVRYPFLDYSTLDRRRAMCEQELRCNRRLAAGVYLGLAALVRNAAGRLAVRPGDRPGDGTVVEWLVQMRRLPDRLMLDRAIRARTVPAAGLERAARHLAYFFTASARVRCDGQAHLARLRRELEGATRAIRAAGIDGARTDLVHRRLLAFLQAGEALLVRRAAAHVIEGHGDLRPEHVFLGEPPAVIDCVEFSREFRLLDPVEELSFLGMECARLGEPDLGQRFFEAYRRASGDEVPDALRRFYMGKRACQRAQLALGHIDGEHDAAPWLARAAGYLDTAGRLAQSL